MVASTAARHGSWLFEHPFSPASIPPGNSGKEEHGHTFVKCRGKIHFAAAYQTNTMAINTSIWRKKPISAYHADANKSDLKRVLTRWGLTSLGIGAIIGGGIFTLTGIAANEYAGPALALAFVIAGVGCCFCCLFVVAGVGCRLLV